MAFDASIPKPRGCSHSHRYTYDCNEDRIKSCLSTYLLNDKTWKKMKLPPLMRALRQHNLKEFTNVEITFHDRVTRHKLDRIGPWCDEMRKLLIDLLPLGQGRSVSERRRVEEETKRKCKRLKLSA